MADLATEAQFLATFWGMATKGDASLQKYMGHVRPEMLEDPCISEAYKIVSERYAKGLPVYDMEARTKLTEILGVHYEAIEAEAEAGSTFIRNYAKTVFLSHRKREQVRLLEEAAKRTMAGKDEGSVKIANSLVDSLISLHSDSGGSKGSSREEMIQAELNRLTATKVGGVSLPYPKLAEQVGNLVPGDCVGIAAYSNGGKSTLAANLFPHMVQSGTPCIVFPTEMRERWLSRAISTHAKVPQAFAEREQWSLASQAQREAYRASAEGLMKHPWDVIPNAKVTVSEIISRSTVLRRKYPGQTVVVMVDHMHRLDYGRDEADFVVGDAVKRLRDWAADDREGGIILVLLLQPRKPSDELELYKPVDGHQIRGKSSVWNELDILLSPYRRWVKTVSGWEKNPMLKTPWGTPVCQYQSKNIYIPEFTKPGDPEGKLDDEHVYLKIGKRRVGGEGPTLIFDIDGPSGRIYEPEHQKKGLVAL